MFAAFGAGFCGAWQYALFVKIMPRLCPSAEAFAAKSIREKMRDGPGLRQLCVQVLCIACVWRGALPSDLPL